MYNEKNKKMSNTLPTIRSRPDKSNEAEQLLIKRDHNLSTREALDKLEKAFEEGIFTENPDGTNNRRTEN